MGKIWRHVTGNWRNLQFRWYNSEEIRHKFEIYLGAFIYFCVLIDIALSLNNNDDSHNLHTHTHYNLALLMW